MRKRTILSLLLIFTLSVLAACAGGGNNNNNNNAEEIEVNKEGYPIVDEELNLTMMAPSVGVEEWENMPTLQEYSEKTNISFEYHTPPADDFDTNLNLAFSSGDLDDIIFAAGNTNLTAGMEVDYGQQEMLLPLEDLIDEYAPNIKKLFEKRPDIEKSITTVDGHIYALPMVNEEDEASWYRGPLWYNGQWLDALDIEELPKTTDELYELLVRFRDEDPNQNGEKDEIPLIDAQMTSSRPWLLAAFGIKEWGIEEVDQTVRYAPIEPEYKEYLEYMNKLYDGGLLDPDTFSQTDEQKQAKGEVNRVGLFPEWYSYFTTGETEEEAMNNPMFYPLVSDPSKEPILPRHPGIVRGAFALSSTNPSPEASIRWVDYFYSQEGWEYMKLGPEGYLWEWDDAKEERVILDPPEGYEAPEEYRATLTPDYGLTTPTHKTPIDSVTKTEFEEFILAETEEKIEPYAEVPYPQVYFTADEQKEINTIEVDLKSFVEQMEARFITGAKPISEWDEYVETIEDMNIDRYIELHQNAYDRWADS